GKNRRSFISRLSANVRQALSDFPKLKIHADRDRMHLILNGEDSDLIILKLQLVFGIQNFSPSIRVEKDITAIKICAQKIMRDIYAANNTFKVTANESDQRFQQDRDHRNVTVRDALIDLFPGIEV